MIINWPVVIGLTTAYILVKYLNVKLTEEYENIKY